MTTKQSITSEQIKQVKRLTEDAIDRALRNPDLDKDGLQLLVEKGGKFQDHVVTDFNLFTSKLPDYTLARLILGNDFISPEEIAKARGLVYTEAQLIEFGKKLPDQATLEAIRDTGMMLAASPSTAMSMLDVRTLNSDYFCSKGPDKGNAGWYDNAKEKFSREDKVESGVWIAFRKEPVEGSFNKTWKQQEVFVKSPCIVPNAAEATWIMTTYKAVRGVYLFPNCYVRTSSRDSDGNRVFVGLFDADGLSVYYWNDVYSNDFIGVSSARKY